MKQSTQKWQRILAIALAVSMAFAMVAASAPTLSAASTTNTATSSDRVLHVTSRANNWDGIDIHRADSEIEMEAGDTLIVTGRADGQPPPGTQMVLGGAENPWNWAANTELTQANQPFAFELTLGANHIQEEQFVRFRIQTNGEGASMSFFVYEIRLERDGEVLYALSTDSYIQSATPGITSNLNNAPMLQQSGGPAVTITTPQPPRDPDAADDEPDTPIALGPLEVVHLVNFEPDNWANYEAYILAGAQMESEIVPNAGRDGSSAIRLTNVTGDYTSGDGNYLQFTLPQPLPIGSAVEISWYVYIPSAQNPGDRTIVGPGLNINGQFGSAPHQPTNDQPAPGDLARETPMDEWVNTTVEFTTGPTVGDIEFLIFRFRVNNNEQQPSVLYIDDIQISTRGVEEVFIPEWDLTLPSLAETFADHFMIGSIWSNPIQMNISNTQEFFTHHFNSVTAENHHKPDFIAGPGPDPSTWNFTIQDQIVDFAYENNMAMVGHTLIWHSQSPTWLTNEPGTIQPLTRAQAMENMHMYISTVAGRYTGRIQAWDVLNEAITTSVGNFTGDWRMHLRRGTYIADGDARWYDAFANGATGDERGCDYIFYAFYFARQYDPYATLFYNDFNEEQPGKRDAIAQMVEYMNERWANHPSYDGRLLIEGIGLQSHHHLDQWATNFDNIRPSIERLAQTGAVLAITELDITVGTQASPSIPLTAEQEARQAQYFARVFAYFLEFSDYIERVTFWGKADSQSWRSWGSPLLFGGDFQAKEAFHAVINQATQDPTPAETPDPYDQDTANQDNQEDPAADTNADDTPATQEGEPRTFRTFFYTREGYHDIDRSTDFTILVNMDVLPQYKNGQILIPLRALTMALGLPQPSWDEATRAVTLHVNDDYITFTPEIINNRAMVTPEFIAQHLNAEVTIRDGDLIITI